MKYEIIGKNIEVTDAIENAVKDSLNDLEKYFAGKEVIAKVVVRTYNVGQKVEVTFVVDQNVIARQENVHDNLYAAIDMVGKKLEKQIRKIKDRMDSSVKRRESVSTIFAVDKFEKLDARKITRRKTLENKPMDEEEAILQFEIIGHDFFVFEDLDEVTKILYKRRDGEYGIIELQG